MTDVKWGKYLDYEGPWVPGSVPFTQVENPDFLDICLEVFTATEGGRFDAINMYDRCIVSVGIIQWCEASQMSVSDMLGELAAKYTLDQFPGLKAHLNSIDASFVLTGSKWRFYMDRELVDTVPEQQQLFLGTSNGKKGSWSSASKERATAWARVLASVFGTSEGQEMQRTYTKRRVMGFVFPEVRKSLFDSAWSGDDTWNMVARVAYLSFAGNNPTIAAKQYSRWSAKRKLDASPKDWCIGLLEALTFAGVSIYPGRYDKIRPVLEKRFLVDLPDFSKDLKRVQDEGGCPISTLASVRDFQRGLVKLGYDLGPHGVDDVWGPKTQAAMQAFQQANSLAVTSVPTTQTQTALFGVLAARGLAVP
jgi:hypothetical protein